MSAEQAGWTLEETIARLGRHPAVAGVLVVGSADTASFHAASDYDLVVVLRASPRAWYVGVVWIAGRIADLLFVALDAVRSLGAMDIRLSSSDELEPVARWLSDGRILIDPEGLLSEVQAQLRASNWRVPETDDAAHRAWFAIHYNLLQTRRMAAGDEDYRRAALLRMSVYGASDLWHGYAAIRRTAWPGDKQQLRSLQDADPTFLALFEAFVAADALEAKLVAYERAARYATSPLGELWRAGDEPTNLPRPPITWSELLADP